MGGTVISVMDGATLVAWLSSGIDACVVLWPSMGRGCLAQGEASRGCGGMFSFGFDGFDAWVVSCLAGEELEFRSIDESWNCGEPQGTDRSGDGCAAA